MVWGYDDKRTYFEKLLKEDNLSHAYLFYGEEGVGKFSFAKELASFIEKGNWENNFPLFDTMILDTSNLPEEKDTLGVEDVLRAENFLYQRPFISPKRILIVNDAYKLTKEAQSALLKIVEEPPSKALIIFISQEKDDLFEALLSRVIKIYFPTLKKSTVKECLKAKYNLDEKTQEKFAFLSFGSIGRALKFLENKKEKEEKIEDKISNLILKLYLGGVRKNYTLIKFLLEKEVAIKRYKRYNLNIKLQEKVINYFLSKNGYRKI